MLLRILWPALALAATGSLAATPVLPGPAFPHFADGAALTAACQKNLATAKAAVRRLERVPPGAQWFAAYDDFNALTEDLSGPIYLLTNVHPDTSVREASEGCEQLWQDFSSRVNQNESLYRAATRSKPRDAVERELRRSILETFEDAGVSLPPDKRRRAKEILDKVSQLSQAFDRNLRDDKVQVAFTEAELDGVPDNVWKTAGRDDQDRVLLGLDYPSAFPVLQRATVPAARERMWRARLTQGGEANLKLLDELATLRREYAQLFGFASYAEFGLRRRMAQSPANVTAFLEEVRGAVTERERRELEELRAAKARDLNRPLDDTRLDRWDTAYYTERVRKERYSVDQQAFRPYFPPQESLAFAMRVIEKLMGVRYERVPGVKLWHEDVQAYAAVDVTSGRPIAALYVDPFPREGKYRHAAVWPFRAASTRLKRVPQAALVVNFDRSGLSLGEMETLLHELGHAVHNNLGAVRYSTQGSGTVADFIEAPSQMLQDWVYDPTVVAVLQEVCPACKPVPEAMLAQADVARRYGRGALYARQQLYARYDLALYGAQAEEPLALWQRLERQTVLGYVPGTMFPASFAHIASNGLYVAGYYGYLWSEVVAADLRTAFAGRKLDPAVGRRYRDSVLARGSERPAQDLVRDFLGRPGNSQAFFEDLKR